MEILKKIPVHYTGELHQVHLVNFSVDKEEVKALVPKELKILDFADRALISMVDVQLRNMQFRAIPGVRFNYQHIGFRLLLDDSSLNSEKPKGVFFLDSFTDRPLFAFGGSLLTEFRLHLAEIYNTPAGMELHHQGKFLEYQVSGTKVPNKSEKELLEKVGAVDRAYALRENNIYKTQIMREQWPLEVLHCHQFETTFFSSAKLEVVFRVPETILYHWLPPQQVKQCA